MVEPCWDSEESFVLLQGVAAGLVIMRDSENALEGQLGLQGSRGCEERGDAWNDLYFYTASSSGCICSRMAP